MWRENADLINSFELLANNDLSPILLSKNSTIHFKRNEPHSSLFQSSTGVSAVPHKSDDIQHTTHAGHDKLSNVHLDPRSTDSITVCRQ